MDVGISLIVGFLAGWLTCRFVVLRGYNRQEKERESARRIVERAMQWPTHGTMSIHEFVEKFPWFPGVMGSEPPATRPEGQFYADQYATYYRRDKVL